jgi:hypothetical protein
MITTHDFDFRKLVTDVCSVWADEERMCIFSDEDPSVSSLAEILRLEEEENGEGKLRGSSGTVYFQSGYELKVPATLSPTRLWYEHCRVAELSYVLAFLIFGLRTKHQNERPTGQQF